MTTFRAEAFTLTAVLLAGVIGLGQDASAIGRVAEIPLGTRLSSSPGAAPDRMVMGSPALVVDVKDSGATRWYRLFAADGTHGWTSTAPTKLVPLTTPRVVEGFEQSPDVEPPEASKVVRVENPVVTGASEKSAAMSPVVLLMPAESNWAVCPLLRMQPASGDRNTSAWVWPHELKLASPLPLRGLVRGIFVREKPVATPPARQIVPRVDEEGDAVKVAKTGYMEEWPGQGSEFVGDAGASLAVLPGKETHLLRITRAGVHRFLIFDKYEPSLRSVAHEDWSGDRLKEWILEVVQLTGDGHRVTLWVISDTAGAVLRASAIELGASSGENGETLTGAVVRDRKRSRLWVVQSDTQATTTRLVRFLSGKADAVKTPAVMLAGELRDTREQAIADALAKGLEVFPVADGGKTKWTAGMMVRNQAEAATVQRMTTGLRAIATR